MGLAERAPRISWRRRGSTLTPGVKDLTEADENKLREAIDHGYTVEGDLRRSVALDIKRLTEIGCYQTGIRLPPRPAVRGQRSKNQRTHPQGSKKTIANKKK